MVRKPGRRRNNPKARKIVAPPGGVDLTQVAGICSYVGSVYHKDRPGFAGTPPRNRPDASICPRPLANKQERVQRWLQKAIRAGHTGAWDSQGRFPRYVWYRDEATGIVYEARLGSPGSGKYHGYPLTSDKRVQGLP